MFLEDLTREILRGSNRRISSLENSRRSKREERVRRLRRSTQTEQVISEGWPALWSERPEYNPFHVRSRAKTIAHAINSGIAAGTYAPHAPVAVKIEKRGGGFRVVNTYPIADEAVSRLLYRRLLSKNLSRFSARSYAYRPDIGVHDAIAYVHSEIERRRRIYIAEYDFRAFFDHIDRSHLWWAARDMGFVATRREKLLIQAFLESPFFSGGSQRLDEPDMQKRGVPQGTALALLLANVAATPLDRELERLGVGFARYADDSLVWSSQYSAIGLAAEAYYSHAEKMGVSIGSEKSEGIRLLTSIEGRFEIPHTGAAVFLSHRISMDGVGLSMSAVDRAKGRLGKLIYDHLLREPIAGTQDMDRLGVVDRDYVSLIWQIRRYMYGRVSESALRRRLRENPPSQRALGGFVAQFPTVSRESDWLELDSWLKDHVMMAIRKRQKLLANRLDGVPLPWGLDYRSLADLQSHSSRTGARVDLRLPSFVRMSRYVRQLAVEYGASSVSSARSVYGMADRW